MPVAVPIDPAKLLEAAHGFATHHQGQGRPRPVWLRRAVSSAYYALFHSIVLTASESLLPNCSNQDRLNLARSFSHQAISNVCQWVASGRGAPDYSLPLVNRLQGTPIVGVATAFSSLRLQRHEADYDHLASFSKTKALAAIQDAERGIQELAAATPEQREAFVALLCLKTTIR
jgi:hypothetical protein